VCNNSNRGVVLDNLSLPPLNTSGCGGQMRAAPTSEQKAISIIGISPVVDEEEKGHRRYGSILLVLVNGGCGDEGERIKWKRRLPESIRYPLHTRPDYRLSYLHRSKGRASLLSEQESRL
jgi:hypothetical protein